MAAPELVPACMLQGLPFCTCFSLHTQQFRCQVVYIEIVVLQANKAAAQQAAEAPAAGKAQEQVAFAGEASTGHDEAVQQQQPIEEAAQAAADSHPQPAEHQKPAETPNGPSASVNAAQFSRPDADAAAQSAAESHPKIGMPASSLLSSSDPAGAAKAAPHLPWQPSQARLCSICLCAHRGCACMMV